MEVHYKSLGIYYEIYGHGEANEASVEDITARENDGANEVSVEDTTTEENDEARGASINETGFQDNDEVKKASIEQIDVAQLPTDLELRISIIGYNVNLRD
ncbi:zinc finger MYM-type protein 1-like [Abeliophyllum distichum]|uniref:Zinc finger MYM-type protein 1-like n=1 Tax=Abeliophyllum distichum TaxID=126358 RepID=A0ABD1SWE5_9LAMI